MSDAFPSDPPATILAIGVAGRVANAALAASPARVLAIVEPRPGEAAAIGRALASDSRVRLVQAMPALASGTVGLTQYSVPGLYSTREPLPALRTLYPGLQTRASAEVEALDMARLLDRLGSLPDPIELWLSAPGSELEILNGLERTGLLSRLSGIQLHGSAEPLFEGAEPAARLQGWLEGHHFRLTEMHESDPDWPLLVLRADTERRELIARADALVERLAVSGEAIAERNRKIAGLETGLAEKAREIDALTAEVAGLRTAVAERDKRIDELDKSATEGWKVAREAQDVAASVRSDLSIALRMQALAQSDLRAVEERYKVAEQARSKQATLLQKLTPRLQQAAQQLQVMAQNDEAARLESEPATKRERGKKPKSGKKRSGGAGT
jgi:hypothetical protein